MQFCCLLLLDVTWENVRQSLGGADVHAILAPGYLTPVPSLASAERLRFSDYGCDRLVGRFYNDFTIYELQQLEEITSRLSRPSLMTQSNYYLVSRDCKITI